MTNAVTVTVDRWTMDECRYVKIRLPHIFKSGGKWCATTVRIRISNRGTAYTRALATARHQMAQSHVDKLNGVNQDA